MSLESSTAVVIEAADLLTIATDTGSPISPVRHLIGGGDIDLAYAVQQELVRRRRAEGVEVVGRKIGLTSPAVQQQLGVDQPDFGVLFADMNVTDVDAVPSERLLQPKVEAEIAFVVGHDLVGGDFTADSVRSAVDYAVAALEIVDSRIANWDLTIADTVADNASSGLFVLGDTKVRLCDFVLREVTMQMYADDHLVSEGTGSACLGDPLNALAWLARTAEQYGEPLRAGQIILSGALGPMAPAPPGTRIRAAITPLGEVSATFSPKDTP